jgi:hypothetical protein
MYCNEEKKGEEPENNLNPWSQRSRQPLWSHGAVDSPPPHGSETEEVVEAEDQLGLQLHTKHRRPRPVQQQRQRPGHTGTKQPKEIH